MSFIGRLLGKAQRYARQNPDKVRGITDKAARFADKRTHGKYRRQIDQAVRKVDGVTGRGHRGRRPDHRHDPHHNDPRYRDGY
ncbi:MAG: antitoxin [Pseudonocardiaceae bacterium]